MAGREGFGPRSETGVGSPVLPKSTTTVCSVPHPFSLLRSLLSSLLPLRPDLRPLAAAWKNLKETSSSQYHRLSRPLSLLVTLTTVASLLPPVPAPPPRSSGPTRPNAPGRTRKNPGRGGCTGVHGYTVASVRAWTKYLKCPVPPVPCSPFWRPVSSYLFAGSNYLFGQR